MLFKIHKYISVNFSCGHYFFSVFRSVLSLWFNYFTFKEVKETDVTFEPYSHDSAESQKSILQISY